MLEINIGNPLPLGSSLTERGVNFSIVATKADFIEILIFNDKNASKPIITFKLDDRYRSGSYWHAEIKGLKKGALYGFKVHQKQNKLNSDYSEKILIDPCSREITGWDGYNRENACHLNSNMDSCLKSVVCERNHFNFDKFPRPKHAWKDSIIYELHVSAFTKNIDDRSQKNKDSSFKKLINKSLHFNSIIKFNHYPITPCLI